MAFLADELFGKRTPIDSVAKLEDLIKIARSDVDSISWLFTSLCDYVLNGVCKVAEMNSSALSGGKSNPKGLPGKICSAWPAGVNRQCQR